MSEPTLVMKLTALRDYVMVLGVSEDDCEVFDEAVEALYNARSAALEEAARIIDTHSEGTDGLRRVLGHRNDGDMAGTGYAAAIRALKDKPHE